MLECRIEQAAEAKPQGEDAAQPSLGASIVWAER